MGKLGREEKEAARSVPSHEKEREQKRRGDWRFTAPEWEENDFFRALKEQFFWWKGNVQTSLKESSAVFPKWGREQLDFWSTFFLDAYSPSNLPFTNPEVIRNTILQNSENYIRGVRNFFEDIAGGGVVPPLTDAKAFTLGENIATTPGNIVFENDFFELIEYLPTNDVLVHRPIEKAPLLLISSWINKYYVFDLTDEKSFIQFNLKQGRRVFVLSWCSPDINSRADERSENKADNSGQQFDFSLDEYLVFGIRRAIEEVVKRAESIGLKGKVNIVAMCAAGTLVLVMLAKTQPQKVCSPVDPLLEHIGSITLLMAPYDFSLLKWIDFFLPSEQFKYISKQQAFRKKVIPGKWLIQLFCLLRANELIWPNFVKRYLLGQDIEPMDFLFWNADAPNLYTELLFDFMEMVWNKNIFFAPESPLDDSNKDCGTLSEEGVVQAGVRKIKNPVFVFGAQRDHIVPWQSCYAALEHLENAIFVLGGGGHIAGCINSPTTNKYYFYKLEGANTSPENVENSAMRERNQPQSENRAKKMDADEWLRQTTRCDGSWWPFWSDWQEKFG
ncbi:MAG: hypothetical protein LBF72_01160 [Holosporales bacterium]|jgi:polyhydroxyalkanoate synthase|nr:hypothetical protein [Holosporales bacterium]